MITFNNQHNLYLDLHVLQTVPPANLNRDDTGAPKTATYGGTLRARVSSQAWKRAMRIRFKEMEVPTLTRTEKLVELIVDNMYYQNNSIDREKMMEFVKDGITNGLKLKFDSKDKLKLSALLAISPWQVKTLAKTFLEYRDLDWSAKVAKKSPKELRRNEAKKAIKNALSEQNSLDLALFGRMVADDPELRVEACAQVAHAISVNEIVPEYDYYSAIDELQADDEQGAAMLGDQDFNSSTLYRYTNVNVRELIADLGEKDALNGLQAYIQSFVMSMPTGKQNSFGARTVPSYILAVLRSDQPVNLVESFETPVRSTDGFMKPAVKKLEAEYEKVQKLVNKPLLSQVISLGVESQLPTAENLNELTMEVVSGIKAELAHD